MGYVKKNVAKSSEIVEFVEPAVDEVFDGPGRSRSKWCLHNIQCHTLVEAFKTSLLTVDVLDELLIVLLTLQLSFFNEKGLPLHPLPENIERICNDLSD